MNLIRFYLAGAILPVALLCPFAAASVMEVHAPSGRPSGPQGTFSASTPSISPASASPSTITLGLTSGGSPVTSVTAGGVVTLTAQVADATTQSSIFPGQVKFCDTTAAYCEDSALLATAQLTSSGTATVYFSAMVGTHTYQAQFVGTHTYAAGTSNKASLVVSPNDLTSTSLTSSGSPGNYTLNATVTSPGIHELSPQGTVSFLDESNGNASLGSATLSGGANAQSLLPSTGFSIPDQVTASVAGDTLGFGELPLAVASTPCTGCSGILTTALDLGPAGIRDNQYTVGSGPSAIAKGDFNGDGGLDLAVANTYDSTVTILLGYVGPGTGGTFTVTSTPGVGSGPIDIKSADLNGDGILDLVTANSGDNTISVLLGNPDGSFTLGTGHAVGANPQALVVGDFNGDGLEDVATANYNDNTVTVLLGKGDGTFTPAADLAVGKGPIAIASADFNQDGKPDLVVANSGDNTITVWLGSGNGTFHALSPISLGTRVIRLAVADFNGDGVSDVAVLSNSTVAILLGNDDGTFSNGPTASAVGDFASLTAADIDGDGIPDVLTTDFYAGGREQAAGTTLKLLSYQIAQTATATLTHVAVPSGGTHQVDARYSGDTQLNGSTSSTIALVGNEPATTLMLTSDLAGSTYGAPVKLTAVLSPYSSASATTNGESVAFYVNGTLFGSSTLASGVAILSTEYLPVGSDTLTAAYMGDFNFAASTSNSLALTVNPGSQPVQNYVVSTARDAASGVASNCTGAGSSNCSLRDAIAAALGAGSGNITFSSTVFAPSQPASARTISLSQVLVIPSNTTITGPTTGSGATLTQLVTITPLDDTAFEVDKGTVGASIAGLAISGGTFNYGVVGAEAVRSDGALSISNSSITGNTSGEYGYGAPAIFNDADGMLTLTNSNVSSNLDWFGAGGGIENKGTLVVTGSTISGNNAVDSGGAGLVNEGTATLTDTSVSDNSILFYNYGGLGGGIVNAGTLNLIDSSVTGNNASNPGDGSGIDNFGTLHITRSSIVSNFTNYNESYDYETFPAVEDDCDGPGCPPEPIPAPPVFNPPSGTYSSVFPTLTDTSPGTVFFYTNDGSTPTTSSTLIDTEPVSYLGNGTIKAIAFANGESSAVATATYTITTGACTLIDYSTGFTAAALTLNGGATVSGSLLQLTDGGFNEARSAFYSTPVPTTEFTTDFQFQLLYPLADGITFTIQSASPYAVGQAGGGLGYAGIPKSIAVKFDLFNNSGEGFDSTGYYFNGAYPSAPALNLSPYGIHLHSGHVFAVHIAYVAQITTATITDLSTYQSYSAKLPGDLTKLVGNTAYVGFTGGTGGLTATQNILTWTYGGGSGCGTTSAP